MRVQGHGKKVMRMARGLRRMFLLRLPLWGGRKMRSIFRVGEWGAAFPSPEKLFARTLSLRAAQSFSTSPRGEVETKILSLRA
jgi:hypothetical protein